MEFRSDAVDAKIKEAKRLLAEEKKKALFNPEEAEKIKQEGNALVKAGGFDNFAAAVKKYTEALKRNPKDHTIFSNRALCYIKLNSPPQAVQDCNKCLDIEPAFVRALVRRGQAHRMLKEMTKAMDDFRAAMELDPNNADARDGLQQIRSTVFSGQRDEIVVQNALKDEKVKAILADPVINNVLQDLQTNPSASQKAMSDPDISAKLEKLMVAGILGTGAPGAQQ